MVSNNDNLPIQVNELSPESPPIHHDTCSDNKPQPFDVIGTEFVEINLNSPEDKCTHGSFFDALSISDNKKNNDKRFQSCFCVIL